MLWGLSLLIDVFAGKKWRARKVGKITVNNNDKLKHEYNCDGGYLHCESSCGSQRTVVSTDLLRGGEIDTSFGDFIVDFSACKAVADDCTIDIDNSFGSLTLLVPKRFLVKRDESQFAASIEIKDSPADNIEGTIHLNVDNSFAVLKIRYVE